MWLALNHATPEDFVFATGKLHTVQDVVETAFAAAGLDWKQFVRQDQRLLRPAEPSKLVGCADKAQRLLGWTARTSFRELIEKMVEAELSEPAAKG
jgi:GDPmannose 4,6-dehydratase